MRRVLIVLALLGGSIGSFRCYGQMFSVGTNIIGLADLGTANLEMSAAVARHLSFNGYLRYNPWTFRSGDCTSQFQNRKRSISVSARWWPWYVYSGWWFSLGGELMEYNRGGLFTKETEEGIAVGAVISGGYTLMIHRNWNLELGLSMWAGGTNYTRYDCPICGRMIESGIKTFLLPDDVKLSVVYVF